MTIGKLLNQLQVEESQKWDVKRGFKKLHMERDQMAIEGGDCRVITSNGHQQLADRIGIPRKYYQRMREEDSTLLAENINTWLIKDENRMLFVRGLGDKIRAFLSDRYRVVDNKDVLLCALNELQQRAEAQECELTETNMFVKFRCRELSDFVKDRGDEIIGGILLENSEVGRGAVNVKPRIFRVQCSNGMIIEQLKMRQIHLGYGMNPEEDDDVYLSIRQTIRNLFNRFGEIVQSLKDSTEIRLDDPHVAISNVVKEYKLGDEQKENILMAFGAEPDKTQYGIANAITRAGQNEGTYERELDFEKIGGEIVTMEPGRFRHLVETVDVRMN